MIWDLTQTDRGWWYLYFDGAGTAHWIGPYRRKWQARVRGWLVRRWQSRTGKRGLG